MRNRMQVFEYDQVGSVVSRSFFRVPLVAYPPVFSLLSSRFVGIRQPKIVA